ncbi:MAG TPA: hypothetical protein DEP99_00520, partial [Nitrospiraceae bacterium]|nr:hypothetical protein [Nitrospiraceae bacterium]
MRAVEEVGKGQTMSLQTYNTIIYDYVADIDNFVALLAENTEIKFSHYKNLLFAIFIMAGLLSIGIAVFTKHSLVTPIRRLRDAAREFTKGNFDTRVMMKSRDEIG